MVPGLQVSVCFLPPFSTTTYSLSCSLLLFALCSLCDLDSDLWVNSTTFPFFFFFFLIAFSTQPPEFTFPPTTPPLILPSSCAPFASLRSFCVHAVRHNVEMRSENGPSANISRLLPRFHLCFPSPWTDLLNRTILLPLLPSSSSSSSSLLS